MQSVAIARSIDALAKLHEGGLVSRALGGRRIRGGTAIIAPLVLSIDRVDQVLGGMLFGGLPAGCAGLVYGLKRVRKHG